MAASGSMAKESAGRNPEAAVKQFVFFAITICYIFAVIAAMTADFAVQNSLYIIAKTATAIVMGYPEGWGVHSPHPFGEPSPSRWRKSGKRENYNLQYFVLRMVQKQ